MRATMHGILTGEPTLTAIVPVGRWYQAGNVVDRPVFPFAVVRWLAPVPGAGKNTFRKQLRIDIHDERGSYMRIDSFLKALTPVLSAVVNVTGTDGRISECDFLGTGGDQEDDVYKSNFSFSSWQVIGVPL